MPYFIKYSIYIPLNIYLIYMLLKAKNNLIQRKISEVCSESARFKPKIGSGHRFVISKSFLEICV